MKDILKQQLQKIPSISGIYFFKDTKGEIIYIGKAVNLKARVKSYFAQKLYGLKAAMIPEIAKIDYKITDTEIDALILESQYIKKHLPKYNVMLKDDKNYFYVVITPHPSRIAQGANPQLSLRGEGLKFPKIFITHQPVKYAASRKHAFEEHPQANLHGVLQYNCAERTAKQIRRGRASGAAGSGASVSEKARFRDAVILGPYTDGTALKTTLRFLRKIFPYCTCQTRHKLPCLKAHLGLCMGICCTNAPAVILRPLQTVEESGDPSLRFTALRMTKENKTALRMTKGSKITLRMTEKNGAPLRMTYKKNIKSIVDILSGRKKSILAKLEGEMKTAAKKDNFEKAAEIRNKITALKNIFEHKIINNTSPILPRIDVLRWENAKSELSKIFDGEINRIEFYDISNIQGQFATGSMVVFDGEKLHPHTYSSSKNSDNVNANIGVGVNKNEYRKFKIKTVHQSDDPAMMKEVLERRLKHTEWPMPDLIIVDGGIIQLNAAKDVLARRGSTSDTREVEPRIASLAKNPDRLFLSTLKAIALKDLPENARLLLQNLRDEAHRFAIGYHRKLRSKKLRNAFDKLRQ